MAETDAYYREDEHVGFRYMPVSEFRKEGYLQEVNRLFFHPLGLALSVAVDEDGSESFGPIWDDRKDPAGIRFADDVIDEEFRSRVEKINKEFVGRFGARQAFLGYTVQPFQDEEKENL